PDRSARGRRLQLRHGRADGRRLHARVPDVLVPRCGGGPRAAGAATGAGVRGLARRSWPDGSRPADGTGRRPTDASVTLDLARASPPAPARLGVGRVGTRPPTATRLVFLGDHAAARDAVWSTWSAGFEDRLRALGFVLVASTAKDRLAYVREPPLGRCLARGELERIRAHSPA